MQFLKVNFNKNQVNDQSLKTSKFNSNCSNLNDVISKFRETFEKNKFSSVARLSSIKKELTEVFKME